MRDLLTLPRILWADAAANVVAGAALLVAGGWLAEPAGLGTAGPIRVVGVLLVIYGVENAMVARRPTRTGINLLIAVDLLFALAAIAVAVYDPAGAATWVRWATVVIADLSATMGVTKIVRGRTADPRFAAPVR